MHKGKIIKNKVHDDIKIEDIEDPKKYAIRTILRKVFSFIPVKLQKPILIALGILAFLLTFVFTDNPAKNLCCKLLNDILINNFNPCAIGIADIRDLRSGKSYLLGVIFNTGGAPVKNIRIIITPDNTSASFYSAYCPTDVLYSLIEKKTSNEIMVKIDGFELKKFIRDDTVNNKNYILVAIAVCNRSVRHQVFDESSIRYENGRNKDTSTNFIDFKLAVNTGLIKDYDFTRIVYEHIMTIEDNINICKARSKRDNEYTKIENICVARPVGGN